MEDKVLMDSSHVLVKALHCLGKKSALALRSDGTAKDRVTFKIWQYNQNGKQQPLKLTQKITSAFFPVQNY